MPYLPHGPWHDRCIVTNAERLAMPLQRLSFGALAFCYDTGVTWRVGIAAGGTPPASYNRVWEQTGSSTGGYRQSVFAEVAADVSTSSLVFEALLSQAITISAGGVLLVTLTASGTQTNNNQDTDFRLSIDGTPKRGVSWCSTSGGTHAGCVALVYRASGLAAGAHTALVEWKVSGGTTRIRPVTAPEGESACLLIQEVSV